VARLQPADQAFIDSPPQNTTGVFAISRPAAEVWQAITADDALHWCRVLSGVKWTSPRPFGVGTTREVKVLGGMLKAKEYFFAWEEGRRKSFYVTEANLPLFRRLAEDYLLEPTGDSSCRFTWRIAYEPSLLGKGPANGVLLGSLMRDTRKFFGAT
jgi:hypothetical protein